jgi:hypothetical protein
MGKPRNYGDIHSMKGKTQGKEKKRKRNLIMAKPDKNEAILIQFMSSH